MGWANNIFPADLLPKITINEKGLYMNFDTCGNPNCNLCNDVKKETESVTTRVNLNKQTEAFKKNIEARTKQGASIVVEADTYAKDPVGSLTLTVPNAYGDDIYAYVVLSEDELKQLQDAVYKARVKLAGAKIKNQDVYPF